MTRMHPHSVESTHYNARSVRQGRKSQMKKSCPVELGSSAWDLLDP